jgi:Aminotransferase class-III
MLLMRIRSPPKFSIVIGASSPGGVSVNRLVQPEIAFVKGQGAHIWDADGNQYIDYHAAFAPHFLGHNDPYVTNAVISVLRNGASLYGSGTTELEGWPLRTIGPFPSTSFVAQKVDPQSGADPVIAARRG